MPSRIIDWLSKNESYARTIAHLAGLKTTPAEGLPLTVSCLWDGQQFTGPVQVRVQMGGAQFNWHMNQGRLYKKTLGMLEETLREMVIPAGEVVGVELVIDNQRKRPHFRAFAFGSLISEGVFLTKTAWDLDELETTMKELKNLKRKLRGIGY